MSEQSLEIIEQSIQCQNCESDLKEGFKFCPNCGQKTNEELTIGILFYNTISNYFSFDARFLKSFIPLMIKPGYLAKKFLEGKRLLYLHPAQMYLFISVVFFFIISFSTREWVQEAEHINDKVLKSEVLNSENETVNTLLDSLRNEQVLKTIKDDGRYNKIKVNDFKIADSIIKAESESSIDFKGLDAFNKKRIDSLVALGTDKELIYKDMGMSDDPSFFERRFFERVLSFIEGNGAGSFVQAIFDSIPISMFFLLPFFALILKVFYYSKGTYAHHLVFSFYYFSYLFTTFSILYAINRFIYDIPDGIDWLIALSTYVYFLLALIRFYGQHWFLTWFKSGVITFIFLLMVLPVAAGIMVAFSFLMT